MCQLIQHVVFIFQVLALILSDVIGDPLEIIASGPTVRPSAAQSNTAEIVREFGLADKLDSAVLQLLLADPEEQIHEDFSHVTNLLLGNISLALQAVIQQAAEVPVLIGEPCSFFLSMNVEKKLKLS